MNADLADPIERAVAAECARRHARWVAGAAIERLKRGPESDADKRDWSLGQGCTPTPEGFAETHGAMPPRESAGARAFARARHDWPGFADALARGAIPVDCIDQLVAVGTSDTAGEWVALAESDPPQFRRRLHRARRAQAPADVDTRRRRVAFDWHPDGSFEAATTLRFSPLQHFDVWHARYRLSAREKMPLSIGEMLPLLVADLAIERRNGNIPRGPDAARGPRIVFVDPLRRVAWVQTDRGWFRIRARDLPKFRRGRRVRVEVLDFGGAPVDPVSPDTLARAFEAIAEPSASAGRDAHRQAIEAAAAPLGGGAAGYAVATLDVERSTLNDVLNGPDPVRHLAGLSALAPDLPADWSPDALVGAGASGLRVDHQLRAVAIDAVARMAGEIERGGRPAADRARLRTRLGWSERTLDDAIVLGARLRELPALRRAFRAGDVGYAKVRALARVATPATEAGWLALAQAHDTAAVEAWVATAAPGDPAPAAPPGCWPLLPLGATIAEDCRAWLEPEAAAELRAQASVLERAFGGPLGPESTFAALCGWWLRRHAREISDVIVYQPSPETRVAADARAALHPRYAALPDAGARLRVAFRWARRLIERPPRQRKHRSKSTNRRTIEKWIRESVRWRDGERCIVPGCGRTLTTQHDHRKPVKIRGRASVRDARLCGACNRALASGGLIRVEAPDGSTWFADRYRRRLGTVRLGARWDGPLRRWCWAAAMQELATRAARDAGSDEACRARFGARAAATGAALIRESRACPERAAANAARVEGAIWTTQGGGAGPPPETAASPPPDAA